MKKFTIFFLIIVFNLKINAQTTLIPDANFEQALINLGLDTAPINGSVLTANISSVDSLNVGLNNINFMTGIEDFTALTYLNCFDNQIYTLDVTQNLNLKYLICTLNNLSTLDLTQNLMLIDLFCSSNPLNSLDITQNLSLEKLLCGNTGISSLNLSQNTSLIHLECYNNQINALDISQNTFLTYFTCSNNLLTTLNVQNGNNTNFSFYASTGNSNLICIQVDNPLWSNSNWTNIDAIASFSTNCSVGITESGNKINATIYPSPTKGYFIVDIVNFNPQNNTNILLVDISGKVVLQSHVVKEFSKIDVSSIPKGFYTLLLRDERYILASKKLVIK